MNKNVPFILTISLQDIKVMCIQAKEVYLYRHFVKWPRENVTTKI